MTNSYTNNVFQNDLLKLQNFMINKKGGKKNNMKNNSDSDNESVSSNNSSKSNSSKSKNKNNKNNKKFRHFKLIEADKKEMNIGYVKISNAGSPLSAAKKLFKSLCHSKNLSGENKLKCNSTFTIQETTQDSKKKIFGPYIGSWKKLSEKEQKEAERAGIKFTMRSVVKLLSTHNNSNKKENNKKENKKKENNKKENNKKENNKNNKKEEVVDIEVEKDMMDNMTGGKKNNKKIKNNNNNSDKIGG